MRRRLPVWHTLGTKGDCGNCQEHVRARAHTSPVKAARPKQDERRKRLGHNDVHEHNKVLSKYAGEDDFWSGQVAKDDDAMAASVQEFVEWLSGESHWDAKVVQTMEKGRDTLWLQVPREGDRLDMVSVPVRVPWDRRCPLTTHTVQVLLAIYTGARVTYAQAYVAQALAWAGTATATRGMVLCGKQVRRHVRVLGRIAAGYGLQFSRRDTLICALCVGQRFSDETLRGALLKSGERKLKEHQGLYKYFEDWHKDMSWMSENLRAWAQLWEEDSEDGSDKGSEQCWKELVAIRSDLEDIIEFYRLNAEACKTGYYPSMGQNLSPRRHWGDREGLCEQELKDGTQCPKHCHGTEPFFFPVISFYLF